MCFCSDRNSELVGAYLAALKRRRYSAKTLQTYGNALQNFTSFLAAEQVETLQDVSAETVEAYRLHLMERGLAPASLEVFMRAVRLLFKWMEETGQLFLNPCRSLIVPNPGRRLIPVPTEEDIRKLLAQPNVSTAKGTRDRALIEVAYASGARREELVRMTIFDPDLKAQTVRVQGKGSKERVVPLGRHAAHWLKQYLDHARPKLLAGKIDQEALWLGNSGTPQGGQSLNLQVKVHARAAGTSVPVTLHALRRACATHMLQRGAHPVQIQMLLGHATMRHLSQYLRLSIQDIKAMHEKSRPGK
jgi:integrase/recombinase XerD